MRLLCCSCLTTGEYTRLQQRINALSKTNKRLIITENSSPNEVFSLARQETWRLEDNAVPCLRNESIIPTDLDVQGWNQSDAKPKNQQPPANAKVISSTSDLSYIRFGSQIFSKNDWGEYIAIDALSTSLKESGSCFEEIASRDSYLVLTARRQPVKNESRGRNNKRNPQVLMSSDNRSSDPALGDGHSGCQICSREPSRSKIGSETSPATGASEQESSDESVSQSSSDDSEGWISAEESWSEGSTEATEDERVPWNALESSEGSESETQSEAGTESIASESETSSNAPVNSFGQLKQESDSEGGDFEFDCESADASGQTSSGYSDDGGISDDIDFDTDEDEPRNRRFRSSRRKANDPGPKGSLIVYKLGNEDPKQVFHFSQPLPTMLYESPPVIHPTKQLVVWPLCRGEMLFADFEGKTYFVRKARPSAKKSTYFPAIPKIKRSTDVCVQLVIFLLNAISQNAGNFSI